MQVLTIYKDNRSDDEVAPMKMKTAVKNRPQYTMFSNRALGALILPLVVEQVLAITVGMVDTMMISYAGEAAISGVSLVDMINTVIINIFAAVATGGSVVISQYIGKKSKDRACSAADQLMMITVLISIGFMSLTLAARRPLLSVLFGSIEADVMENALIYLVISAYSYPFLAVFNSCAAVLRSIGNSRLPMYVSVGMNVMNAIGNAILIFGFHMGVAGAAWSTFASRTAAAVVMFLILLNRRFDVYLTPRRIFSWQGGLIRKILYIAVPSGVENGIFQFGRVIVVSIISEFGTVQIAANAVANNLDAMGCIAGQAMNLAMITVVGQCIGAGDDEQAAYYIKKLLKITYFFTWCVNCVILLALPWILNIYTLSPEARHLAFVLIVIHNGFAMLLWPTSFTLSHALRATGDVKFTMVVSVFSMCAFRVCFSAVLGMYFGLGAVGVWIAMVMDWVFRVTLFVTRFFRGTWRGKSVV